MKKNVLLYFVLLAFAASGALKAQDDVFAWVKNYNGIADDYIYGMTVDKYGNSYVTGKFKSAPLTFGEGVEISAVGLFDIYVAKIGPTGEGIWAKKAGGMVSNESRAVAVDDEGSVVITGGFFGTGTFDDLTLQAVNNFDSFIAKYDQDGNLSWVVQGKGYSQVKGTGLAVDSEGNYLTVGYFSADTVNIGGVTLQGHGNRDIYVAKISPEGEVIWVQSAGGTASGDEGTAICLDENDNVYITGSFRETGYFGTIELEGGLQEEMFTAKLDSEGNWLWAQGLFGPNVDKGYAIDYAEGSVFVGGYMSDTLYVNGDEVISNGADDMVIAVYGADGTFMGGGVIGGPEDDHILTIQGKSSSEFIIGGYYKAGFDLLGNTLPTLGDMDILIAEFNADQLNWFQTHGGADSDDIYGLHIDEAGNIYAAGNVKSMDATFGDFSVTSTGGRDPWVGRIGNHEVPVELSLFNASVSGSSVILNWTTVSELNNSGFEIERSVNGDEFRKIGFVKGAGTTTEKTVYTFTDKSDWTGKASYRLKQVDYDGSFEYSQTVEAEIGKEYNYGLSQNYPNPFNPETVIRFSVPVDASVKIELFNVLGQKVADLYNNKVAGGLHNVSFNAANLTSGVYIYKIDAQGIDGSSYNSVKKMTLMR